jgi:hypothetical protein
LAQHDYPPQDHEFTVQLSSAINSLISHIQGCQILQQCFPKGLEGLKELLTKIEDLRGRSDCVMALPWPRWEFVYQGRQSEKDEINASDDPGFPTPTRQQLLNAGEDGKDFICCAFLDNHAFII